MTAKENAELNLEEIQSEMAKPAALLFQTRAINGGWGEVIYKE